MKDFERKSSANLQVLICAYGKDGIERVASGQHPPIDGVEYIISWQIDVDCQLPESLKRDDFLIFTSSTKGLSINRNIALSKATAPILLISDDDADYSAEQLKTVIDAFSQHPKTDLIAFRYASSSSCKKYPDHIFSLSNPPKGYFTSSIELAFRKDSVKGNIWFNENFGIGAFFPSGEEDVFIKDCLDKGLKGIYIPQDIVRHDMPTTSERNLFKPSRPQTKGAIFIRLHPYSWPLRMLAHAKREIPMWRKGKVPSPISYCLNWLKGVVNAKRLKVFPTIDYSTKYSCDE